MPPTGKKKGKVKDVPEVFSGTVEVDETYPGGQWRNKRNASLFIWQNMSGDIIIDNSLLETKQIRF